MLSGCADETTQHLPQTDEMPVQEFLGYRIPVFPTAQEQLNYAKSGITDLEKKKAAFKIISRLFPDDKEACGSAALYDAYLTLGHDYRFADKTKIGQAVNAYQSIIRSYQKHPIVMVKAYWYLGWMHCDLLEQKLQGIQYFWHIASHYPDISMGITPPVPWISLVYPENSKPDQHKVSKVKSAWGGTALMEIIRHTNDQKEAVRAFEILWQDYKNSLSTGLALLLMLKHPQNRNTVKNYVQPYLALNKANPYLMEEIRVWSREH